MLTMGQFSKICKVSTKTLRYYETIDLFESDLYQGRKRIPLLCHRTAEEYAVYQPHEDIRLFTG